MGTPKQPAAGSHSGQAGRPTCCCCCAAESCTTTVSAFRSSDSHGLTQGKWRHGYSHLRSANSYRKRTRSDADAQLIGPIEVARQLSGYFLCSHGRVFFPLCLSLQSRKTYICISKICINENVCGGVNSRFEQSKKLRTTTENKHRCWR